MDKHKQSTSQPDIMRTASLPHVSHFNPGNQTSDPTDRPLRHIKPSVAVGRDPIPQDITQSKRVRIPTFLRNKQLSFRKWKDRKGKGQHRVVDSFRPTRHDFLLEQHLPAAPPLTSSEAEEDLHLLH